MFARMDGFHGPSPAFSNVYICLCWHHFFFLSIVGFKTGSRASLLVYFKGLGGGKVRKVDHLCGNKRIVCLMGHRFALY